MIDDKPEAWETLDLATLELVLLNAGGGWLSSSTGHSTISGSDFAAGSREVDPMVDVAPAAAVESV